MECDFLWQGQHFVKSWEIAGARNVAFFHTKCLSKMGRVRSPKRWVRDDDFIVGLSSDHGRFVFILAEAIQAFSIQILNSWQVQYLVVLDGNQCCSAHRKER